jgi:hypothetical protein
MQRRPRVALRKLQPRAGRDQAITVAINRGLTALRRAGIDLRGPVIAVSCAAHIVRRRHARRHRAPRITKAIPVSVKIKDLRHTLIYLAITVIIGPITQLRRTRVHLRITVITVCLAIISVRVRVQILLPTAVCRSVFPTAASGQLGDTAVRVRQATTTGAQQEEE